MPASRTGQSIVLPRAILLSQTCAAPLINRRFA
jgi:hypothetical protein